MRGLRASIVLAVSLSFLSYLFDIFHGPFWTAGLGDWIDPYFINYLLEHWYHAVSTFSNPASPPMFYPAQKTLGYSHGLFLYAPFYVPIRIFLHPFLAYSVTLFIVIETGILCLYAIFRRFLRLSFPESLLLTVFFFTSQNVTNATIGVWSQRASVFLIPPIVLLSLISWRQRLGARRLVLAATSGLLALLLFPHDFYSGYFAFFFAAVFLGAWIVVEGHVSRLWRHFRGETLATRVAFAATVVAAAWTLYVSANGGARLRIFGLRISSQDWLRPALLTLVCVAVLVWTRGLPRIRLDSNTPDTGRQSVVRPWVWPFAIGAAVGCAVFLWTYLPAYMDHRRFPEQDLLNQIRVRAWPRWWQLASDFQRLSAYYTLRSFKFVALLGVLACVPRLRIDRNTRAYILCAAAVSLLVFLMPLRIDGFSIWLSFLRHVPGFSVIRDPARVIFEYELAFILAAGLLLARLRERRSYRLVICVLMAVFLATDFHVDRLGYERPLNVFRRWVEAPLAIDPACRSFYVRRASDEYMSRSENMWALYAGDAMFVALREGLPTLNGYSAWGPPGWDLANPQGRDYRDRVRDWIQHNRLTDVCELDIEARTMRLTSLD